MGSFKVLGSAFLVGASLLPTTRSIQKAIADPPAKVATLEGDKKAQANPQTINQPKHKLVPDFCQRDTRFGTLPDDGKLHCGPAALSNLFMYLNNTGFSALLSKEKPGPRDQFELIKLLGSEKYMKTSKETAGTSPYNLMQGVKKYIKDKGYKAIVKYKGYKVDADDGNIQSSHIAPRYIKNKLDRGFESVIRIGFYNDSGSRVDGHYAAVVGFKNGTPLEIKVHDSSGASGLEEKTELWKFTNDKKGYWQVSGVANALPGETVYLDGAIVFKLFKK